MHVLDCDKDTSNKNLPNVRVRALHTVQNLHALCFEVSLGSLEHVHVSSGYSTGACYEQEAS